MGAMGHAGSEVVPVLVVDFSEISLVLHIARVPLREGVIYVIIVVLG